MKIEIDLDRDDLINEIQEKYANDVDFLFELVSGATNYNSFKALTKLMISSSNCSIEDLT